MANQKERLAALLQLIEKVSDTAKYDNDNETVIVDMEAYDTLIDYVVNEFDETEYAK